MTTCFAYLPFKANFYEIGSVEMTLWVLGNYLNKVDQLKFLMLFFIGQFFSCFLCYI